MNIISKLFIAVLLSGLVGTSTAFAEWTPAKTFAEADLTKCSFRYRFGDLIQWTYLNADKTYYRIHRYNNTTQTDISANFEAEISIADFYTILVPGKVVSQATLSAFETNYNAIAKHSPGFYHLGLSLKYTVDNFNRISASIIARDYLANSSVHIAPGGYPANAAAIALEKNCK